MSEWADIRDGGVVFEDEAVLVLNKPAGISVMGERHETDLVRMAAAAGEELFPVHRIDKVTSGAVLFAKELRWHGPLTRQFAARTVGKTYLAITGPGGLPARGVIDLPLSTGRKGRVRVAAPRASIVADSGGGTWSVPASEVFGRVRRVLPHGGEGSDRRVGPHVPEDLGLRDRPGAAGAVGDDAGPRGGHPDAALAARAERQVDDTAGGQAAGDGDGEVGLADGAPGELAGQRAVPAQFLREQDGAGGHLVDPVHREQLLARGGGHPDQVGLVPFAHDGDAGRLVQHQHGLVLEDHAAVPDAGPLAHAGSLGHLPARHLPGQNRQYRNHRSQKGGAVRETTQAGPGGAPVCTLDPFADGFLRDPFSFHNELR